MALSFCECLSRVGVIFSESGYEFVGPWVRARKKRGSAHIAVMVTLSTSHYNGACTSIMSSVSKVVEAIVFSYITFIFYLMLEADPPRVQHATKDIFLGRALAIRPTSVV